MKPDTNPGPTRAEADRLLARHPNLRRYGTPTGPVLVLDCTGEPDAFEGQHEARATVRIEHRTWSKGSARTAGPAKAAGTVAVRTGPVDLEPPGCAWGHSARRLARCDECGTVACQGPGHPDHACPPHRHGPECYPQSAEEPLWHRKGGPACGNATPAESQLAERLAALVAYDQRRRARAKARAGR
jgi:hypothetical protein